jgi:hypothetical protein
MAPWCPTPQTQRRPPMAAVRVRGRRRPVHWRSRDKASAVPPARPAGTASSAPLQGDNPWSNLSSGQISAPATQQAALPPPPPPQSAPAPAIAVQSPPPAGSYVVQVAAQKSEGEAQASWQTLQQRYSNVLGGQQARSAVSISASAGCITARRSGRLRRARRPAKSARA